MISYLQYAQYLPKPTQQLDNASPGLGGWAEFLSSLFWPLVILIIFLFLWINPRRLRELLRPFRSLKMFGAEFVLSEKLSEEIGKDAEEAFILYRKQAKREYDRLVDRYDLRQKLESVIQSDVTRVLGSVHNIPGFRCTIHVPDILFKDTIYQLLDYYPTGGRRGRAWSARFGMIGKAWRLRESEIRGSVPTDARKLMLEWGMTSEEAAASGQGRKSFACVVLRDGEVMAGEGTAVGIFYMDSTEENAFGSDTATQKRLQRVILDGCRKRGLTNDLAKLRQELQSRSPMIKIYEEYR